MHKPSLLKNPEGDGYGQKFLVTFLFRFVKIRRLGQKWPKQNYIFS